MRIAILGTGLMGSAIGKRLLDTGHQVTVWNRTVDKARPMAERGALVAASADAAISDADAVLLVLHDMHAIQAVLLTELGLEAAAGRTIVQMGTIAPEESVELSARLRAASAAYLEAPVLGSTPQARAGDLLLMIAGDRSVSDRLNPLWSDLGGPPTYLGEVGKAAALKLSINQLLIGLVASFSLSVAMVLEAGVPIETFMGIVHKSSLRSPQFDKKLPRMLSRDFSDPHFPVSAMLKDVELIIGEAERMGLGTEMVLGIRSILERALEMGFDDVDYSAVYNAIHLHN